MAELTTISARRAAIIPAVQWKVRMEYKRQVAMRCDGADFVIATLPGNEIIFRTKDARALRNLCRQLRWQIAVDTTLSIDDWTEAPLFDPAKPTS
jgi:hypothetical protein